MFQSIIQDLLGDLDNLLIYIYIYIDDILVIQRKDKMGSSTQHQNSLKKILEESGVKANLQKIFFVQK